jgi:hypothetical protein
MGYFSRTHLKHPKQQTKIFCCQTHVEYKKDVDNAFDVLKLKMPEWKAQLEFGMLKT